MMLWEEIVDRAGRMDVRTKDVFREEVQKAVLTALSQKGCFNDIVFQGGTALRLFHGNPRFSEDIDLVLREGVDSYDLSGYMPNVKRFVHNAFPFLGSTEVRVQKDGQDLQRYILRTRSDNAEQDIRLHIEFAAVPSHRDRPRILDFPPFQPAVRVEDAVEILADKVVALAFRPYIKGRDLWDIYFLTKERSVELQWDLVWSKVEDYNELASELVERLERAGEKIQEDGGSILGRELERFLPVRVMDHYPSPHEPILGSVLELISSVEGEREAIAHEGR